MRKFILIIELLLSAVVLTASAILSTSFAVREGRLAEDWITTAMAVVSVLALGGAVVFSENAWVRRSSLAALGLITMLGAIANSLLLEPPAGIPSPLPDVVRALIFGTIALLGPAMAHLVSILYRANSKSNDGIDTHSSEVAPIR
ncbi:hypothetical protein Rhow_003793 [Rhodococcus wratislaviensis]|uniref:Uncharacterized protein n=1 Tax=Rhodococcus wratislaviensis TaxID=44752 RepID=A0A402C969_RHOWR|nr:hypothetical protein [Rhodococcus wratislaviensis]GCE40150.1 hypothetical protein Rhow_003793 [Rhodococcus wratislaviensis]